MSWPVLRVACAVLQSRTESDRANCSLRFLRQGLAPATAKPNLSNSETKPVAWFSPTGSYEIRGLTCEDENTVETPTSSAAL
jgi:hypothetical protein